MTNALAPPTPTDRRILVVNADDFGQSDGVTRGIIEAFERGIVTSTSMMVRWTGAPAAAAYARANPRLAVGLHLDFGEWALRDGEWVQLYETVDPTNRDLVERETRRQLESFRTLLDSDPTHLDSHQHVHSGEPARSIATTLAVELGVPLRQVSPDIAYCGSFYGQDEHGGPNLEAIQVQALIELLRTMPPGVTELACHPGYADGLDTMYRLERATEVRTLCAPELRRALLEFEIELKSFRDLRLYKHAVA
jgi:chitin disaccharide deacetylase